MSAVYGAIGQISNNEVQDMGNRLTHRGKYNIIETVSKECVVGFCSHEADNRIFKNEGYLIVADASIYNRDELEEYLSGRGYRFKNGSDEEIILALYQFEGHLGINLINGDYAFIIWDDNANELILGRDYLGSRPLYYIALSDIGFVYASEYKALLTVNAYLPQADLDMIQHLQHCKILPNGRTLLKDIYAVPSGALTVVNEKGAICRQERFPLITMDIKYLSEQEYSQRLLNDFFRAVDCRVVNQGKVGIALSGGIDSIAVASAYRQLFPEAQIHTFTAGYGKDDPEMITASEVAEKMQTIHHEIITPPEIIEKCLREVIWHMEDAIQRSETVQLYEIARESSKFVEVILFGLAADAIFAGMPRHKILWLAKMFPVVKRSLEEFYNLTQTGIRPKTLLGKVFDSLYFKGNLPGVPKVNGTNYVPETFKFPAIHKEFINSVLSSIFQNAVPTSLPKTERSFSAWGVRYSSPFFDKRMIQTGFSIPDAYKIKRGKEKYILRKALRSIIPPEVLNVHKFPQRMKNDLAFSNVLDAISEKVLSRERVEKRGFFNFSDIKKIRDSKKTDGYVFEAAMRIWTAVLTEIWAEEFLDNRGDRPNTQNAIV